VSAPLADVRVVALEQAVAAPLCTRHLADLGADVVKLERPGSGDFARHYDTVVRGESAHFVWLNRGKRSVTVDLALAADRALLDALLDRADAFVHNLGPGAVDRLGLDWGTIHQRWPRLIACGISGYGTDGPYRDRKAFDLLLQGESAVMAVTGSAAEPAKVGVSIADISAGLYAFSSILAALYERQQTGLGRRIEISMLECLAEWMMPALYYEEYAGRAPGRAGTRHNMIVPYGPYAVSEGPDINLAVQNEGQWRRLCAAVLERPDLADHPHFCTNALRVQNRGELEPLIERCLATVPRATIVERLQRADVPFGSLNEVADLLSHPQLAARRRWVNVATPGGPARALVPPMNLDGLDCPIGAVPRLGEHTLEVRRELNHTEGELHAP
jgi:itaconate CoA-transferase